MSGKMIYSDEELINQLKDHYSRNMDISRRKFKSDLNVCNPTTVIKRFGSWTNALILAGVYTPKKVKLTEKQILDQLKEFYKKNSGISVKSFDQDKSVCGTTTVMKYFGSWNNALIKAGLKEKTVKIEYSDEELIEIYREFSLKIGKTKNGATTREVRELNFPCPYSLLYLRFTTLNNVRRLAGFTPKGLRKIYSKDEIVLLLNKEYKKRKRILLKREIEEIEDFPSITTIFRHFKTIKIEEVWEEVFQLTNKKFIKFTLREKILMQLQNYYSKDPDMNKELFKKDKSLYSVETVAKEFGSWNKALVEAGIYEKEDEKALSKEKIIEQLKQHYLKNPDMTVESFEKDRTVCSVSTIRNKFGTWSKALLEAGIYIREDEKLSEEKIIKQLQQHYLKNSGITWKSFSNDKDVCSGNSVTRKFGSWEKALLAAGIEGKDEKLLKEKERIIEQLRQHFLKNPDITQKSFGADKNVCSPHTVKNKFGSWDKALMEAGIHEVEKPSKSEVIEDLKQHYLKNKNITQESFGKDKNTCSTSTAIRRFGSWNKALMAADIKK